MIAEQQSQTFLKNSSSHPHHHHGGEGASLMEPRGRPANSTTSGGTTPHDNAAAPTREASLTTMTSSNNAELGDLEGPTGCYLVYEGNSGGRLMLHYSLGYVPDNAVGFWLASPSHPIQPFKFKQAGGRSELIKGIAGGDANRRKYFVGWCQFLKLARARYGRVIMFSPAKIGVAVDIYGYNAQQQHPEFLDLASGLIDIQEYQAFAVVPRHAAFLRGVKTIVMSNFIELANLAGASTSV